MITASGILRALLKSIGIWAGVLALTWLPYGVSVVDGYSDDQAFFGMMLNAFGVAVVYLVGCGLLLFRTDGCLRMIGNSDLSSNGIYPADEQELFSVFVKAMGAWFVVEGFAYLPTEIARLMQIYEDPADNELSPVTLATGGIFLVSGVFMLFGADSLVRVGYQRPVASEPGDSEEETLEAG